MRSLCLALRLLPSHRVLSWSFCAFMSMSKSSHKGTNQIGLGPTHLTLFLIASFKALSLNTVTFGCTGETSELSHVNFLAGIMQPITGKERKCLHTQELCENWVTDFPAFLRDSPLLSTHMDYSSSFRQQMVKLSFC